MSEKAWTLLRSPETLLRLDDAIVQSLDLLLTQTVAVR